MNFSGTSAQSELEFGNVVSVWCRLFIWYFKQFEFGAIFYHLRKQTEIISFNSSSCTILIDGRCHEKCSVSFWS